MRVCLQVVVVALLSLFVAGMENACDPSDCLPGPVLALFEHDNCSGTVFFNNLESIGACNSGNTLRVEGDEIFEYNHINNDNCDITLPNATYSYTAFKFGVCIPGGLKRSDPVGAFGLPSLRRNVEGVAVQSSMYLTSVNATYTAQSTGPSTNVHNLPEFNAVSAEISCYGPNNCTDIFGEVPPIIVSEYSEPGNCSSITDSLFFNTTRLGTCYWFYPRTAYVQCAGEYGYDIVFSVDEDCARPYGRIGNRQSCAARDSSIGFSCRAPSSPFTVAPTSTASSLHLAPFAFIILALLAIIVL